MTKSESKRKGYKRIPRRSSTCDTGYAFGVPRLTSSSARRSDPPEACGPCQRDGVRAADPVLPVPRSNPLSQVGSRCVDGQYRFRARDHRFSRNCSPSSCTKRRRSACSCNVPTSVRHPSPWDVPRHRRGEGVTVHQPGWRVTPLGVPDTTTMPPASAAESTPPTRSRPVCVAAFSANR